MPDEVGVGHRQHHDALGDRAALLLEGDSDRAVATAGVCGVEDEVEGIGAPPGAGEDQVDGLDFLLRLAAGGRDDRLAQELPAADDGVGGVLLIGRGLAVVVDERRFEAVVVERLNVEAVQQVAELQHGGLLESGVRAPSRRVSAYLTRAAPRGTRRGQRRARTEHGRGRVRWCRGRDSNAHGREAHYPLKIACLPIPPPRRKGKLRGERGACAPVRVCSKEPFHDMGRSKRLSTTFGRPLPGDAEPFAPTAPPATESATGTAWCGRSSGC